MSKKKIIVNFSRKIAKFFGESEEFIFLEKIVRVWNFPPEKAEMTSRTTYHAKFLDDLFSFSHLHQN